MRWPQLFVQRSSTCSGAVTSSVRLDDELRFHLDARADDLMARRKLSRDEAIRQSRIEFGGVEKYRERVREARGFRAV